MFTIDAIVLKKNSIKENKNLFHLFSKDFGKINAWINESKLKYPIDLGNIINCVIKTKNNVNFVDSYKLKQVINYENLTFESIENILNLLNYIGKLMPEGVPFEDIFDDYNYALTFLEKNESNSKVAELLKLKIIRKCGISLNHEQFKTSQNLKRLYNAVNTIKFDNILKINGVTSDLIKELQIYNNESFRNFILI